MICTSCKHETPKAELEEFVGMCAPCRAVDDDIRQETAREEAGVDA